MKVVENLELCLQEIVHHCDAQRAIARIYHSCDIIIPCHDAEQIKIWRNIIKD